MPPMQRHDCNGKSLWENSIFLPQLPNDVLVKKN